MPIALEEALDGKSLGPVRIFAHHTHLTWSTPKKAAYLDASCFQSAQPSVVPRPVRRNALIIVRIIINIDQIFKYLIVSLLFT